MRVDVMVLSSKTVSQIASETGRTELDVLRMLKKADAIGHTCIFSKGEGEDWTYNLIRKSTGRSKIIRAA